MNTKEMVVGGAIGAVIAGVIGLIIASLAGVFAAGTDALAEDQIRLVIREEMEVIIDGETKTMGEAISGLHTKLTAVEAALEVLVEE